MAWNSSFQSGLCASSSHPRDDKKAGRNLGSWDLCGESYHPCTPHIQSLIEKFNLLKLLESLVLNWKYFISGNGICSFSFQPGMGFFCLQLTLEQHDLGALTTPMHSQKSMYNFYLPPKLTANSQLYKMGKLTSDVTKSRKIEKKWESL